MALTQQTRIQLIDQVDNTFAKINVTLKDTHVDWLGFVLVQCQFQNTGGRMVRPCTYGWPAYIQTGVKPLVVGQWVRRERVSLEGSGITHVSYPGSHG